MASHEENVKKPIYKKAWFWIIIIVIAIIIGASQNNNTVDTSTNNYQKNNSVEVTIVDFSTMSKEEVKTWMDTNKLNGKITEEYSNALKKAETYSNSLHMSKQGIYNQLTSSVEGFTKEAAQYAIDNIEADWNKNALEKAKTYQTSMSMSSKAIYNQLTSSVEGFTKSEAQYAIDNLDK